MGPIAREIEGAIANLWDPSTKWVNGEPKRTGESCAVYRWKGPSQFWGGGVDLIVSDDTECFLDDFVQTATIADLVWVERVRHGMSYNSSEGECCSITEFNDGAKDKRQVWLMLEEALDFALEARV